MLNFKRIIKKYSKTPPELRRASDGFFDYKNGGTWKDGPVDWIEFEGAVLPLDEKVIFDNASYTTDDRKLYTYAEVQDKDVIRYRDREYTAMTFSDYGEFDEDLKIFILKAGGKDD